MGRQSQDGDVPVVSAGGLYLRGLLLYCREDAGRNASYIHQYQQEGRSLGMDIQLVLVEELCEDETRVEDVFADYVSTGMPPDFVINRTRMYLFGEILEDRGIPVFNSSLVSRVGNDKWEAYTFFKQHLPGLPMAETKYIASDDELSRILFSDSFREYREKYPVIKSCQGHGGQEVYLLSGRADGVCGPLSKQAGSNADTVYKALAGKACIAQRRIPAKLPTDIRVYVLGGKIYAAMKRTGQPGGFLANFSKGGHACPVSLTASQHNMVEAVLDVLPMDYAGIDFIEDVDGNWYLGEIEDMVGARMLWESQKISPVRAYLCHIKEKI